MGVKNGNLRSLLMDGNVCHDKEGSWSAKKNPPLCCSTTCINGMIFAFASDRQASLQLRSAKARLPVYSHNQTISEAYLLDLFPVTINGVDSSQF